MIVNTLIHIEVDHQSVSDIDTPADVMYGVTRPVEWSVKMERSDWAEKKTQYFWQNIKEKKYNYHSGKQTNVK